MKRAKQPVIVYEREGADRLITFYHHITIHGNRQRIRLEALGRHKRNSKGYLVAKRSAQEAATVKCADIFRGDFGIVENRGHVLFMQLVREHCEGKARERMRLGAAEEYWKRTQQHHYTRTYRRPAHPGARRCEEGLEAVRSGLRHRLKARRGPRR